MPRSGIEGMGVPTVSGVGRSEKEPFKPVWKDAWEFGRAEGQCGRYSPPPEERNFGCLEHRVLSMLGDHWGVEPRCHLCSSELEGHSAPEIALRSDGWWGQGGAYKRDRPSRQAGEKQKVKSVFSASLLLEVSQA